MDRHDSIIAQISAEKREEKLGLVRSLQKDGSSLSANISRVEGRLQKLQSREEKGLGYRTIKLWAAVCCVNQERPNSGLL